MNFSCLCTSLTRGRLVGCSNKIRYNSYVGYKSYKHDQWDLITLDAYVFQFGSLEEFQEEFKDINQEEQILRLHRMLAPHLLRSKVLKPFLVILADCLECQYSFLPILWFSYAPYLCFDLGNIIYCYIVIPLFISIFFSILLYTLIDTVALVKCYLIIVSIHLQVSVPVGFFFSFLDFYHNSHFLSVMNFVVFFFCKE